MKRYRKATTKTLYNFIEEHLVRVYDRYPIVAFGAKGVWVWDMEGKKYLDCLATYSAVNQGHGHARIAMVAKKQISAGLLAWPGCYYHDKMASFLGELTRLCKKNMVLPASTGAEAVEKAIKTARKWGYKRKKIGTDKAEIIVFENNFHGRTTTVISASTEPHYREGFGPFTPGFRAIPYGSLELLRSAIRKNTVAVLIEPIQGEGGIIIPPDGFLRGVYNLCMANNVLMIADEIQTGLGRTGKMFACDHESVTPDIYILGKALSGGFAPVSAIVANDDILGVFDPGSDGSTYGGNPYACAVSAEAIQVLIKEQMCDNSALMGAYFMERLKMIRSPLVKEVRGRGLMIGIELNCLARPICVVLQKEGIITQAAHDRVLRISPPLVITKKEIDWAVPRIERALIRT